MKNIVMIILISFLFTGCIRKDLTISLQPNTKVSSSNSNVSMLVPTSYSKTPFKTWKESSRENVISIFRTIPNMMIEDIMIFTVNINDNDTDIDTLLHKDKNKTFDKEFTNRYLDDWMMSNYLERRVNYSKRYINYAAKLKCMENVQSSNIANGVGSKKYSVTCPYYDKQGNKKYIHISASINFTFDSTKFEGSDSPSLVRYKLLDIEKQFKMDMKEILDSLEIYDIDIERMRKDELLYDKKYDIEAESKAKDLTFNCKYANGNILCEGKEINRKCNREIGKNKKWECK